MGRAAGLQRPRRSRTSDGPIAGHRALSCGGERAHGIAARLDRRKHCQQPQPSVEPVDTPHHEQSRQARPTQRFPERSLRTVRICPSCTVRHARAATLPGVRPGLLHDGANVAAYSDPSRRDRRDQLGIAQDNGAFSTIAQHRQSPSMAKFQFRATNPWIIGTHNPVHDPRLDVTLRPEGPPARVYLRVWRADSTSRQIRGVKISCMARSNLPPGTTMLLARDMNELSIIDKR